MISKFPYAIVRLAPVAAAAWLLAACRSKPAQRAAVIPVQVSPAVKIDAPVMVGANGVVDPLQTVSVEAQVGGTLTEVNFNEGDDVQAGQVLFRIDSRPFVAALHQAEGALARDSAQAASSRRDAARYKALVAKDYVTQSQADQAEATAAAQTATVESDRAAVENARLNLNYTTITAPISGRTGSLLVKQGNLVKPGAGPLVVINQIQPILVRFPVTQQQFIALRRRSAQGPVPVRVVGADSVQVGEAGMLTFLDNAVDSLTGTVTAKARFANGGHQLWPGEYVRVSAQLDVRSGATAVPSSAVLEGQDGSYVFVIDAEQSAHVRTVSAGQAVGNLTVIEHGVTPGERVVVDGQSRLVPGSKVDAKEIPATPAISPAESGPVAQQSGAREGGI